MVRVTIPKRYLIHGLIVERLRAHQALMNDGFGGIWENTGKEEMVLDIEVKVLGLLFAPRFDYTSYRLRGAEETHYSKLCGI